MKYKLYFSYQSDYWLIDESMPWHYARSMSIEDFFINDVEWESRNAKYINLGKLRKINEISKYYIKVYKNARVFILRLKDKDGTSISSLESRKWEKCAEYIQKCNQLHFFM